MKGWVTLLMILAHIFQFYLLNDPGIQFFSDFVNLLTFPAFLFCFGFACNLAYFQKDILPRKRIFIGAIKLLLAFYISAFGAVIIHSEKIDYSLLLPILYFSHISEYSEFLLSFFYLYIIILSFGDLIKRFIKNGYLLFFVFVLSLITTYIPTSGNSATQLSPLLGGIAEPPSFPILQNFGFFLIGAFISDRNILFDKKILFFSCFGMIYFEAFVITFQVLPCRFPPSLIWILGGFLPVYSFYLLSHKFASFNSSIVHFCTYLGRKTLICLVVSNLCLFSLHRFVKPDKSIPLFSNITLCLLFFVIILVFCVATIRINDKIKSH